MIAPFPKVEFVENPYKLQATIYANTLEPQLNQKDEALRVIMGTRQLELAMFEGLDPSQPEQSIAKVVLSQTLIQMM